MKRILFGLMVLTLALTACGARANSEFSTISSDLGAPSAGGNGFAPQESFGLPGDAGKSADGLVANSNTVERMVIKNADMSVVVKDPKAEVTNISKMAEALGGYLVSSNVYEAFAPSGVMAPEANVVVRIPAEKLDEFMKTIKDGATEVQSENVNGTDVTSQYIDLESQLKNLQAAESQLMEIMKGAVTTEDVLNVYNQLTSIRGQIESIKGQMKYFEESAALSSLSVRLIAEETVQPITIGGWHLSAWASDAVQGFLNFLQDFTEFTITFLLDFLPRLVVIGIVFGLPLRWLWRKMRGSKSAVPVEEKK